MTDITELAQREKFEAWWEREYKHLESSKYTDAVPHIKYGFWMAYQAGGAELESRTVKLPELCVGVVQGGHAVMVPYAAGHWFNKTAILEMLAAAGIKWERE
ncbi:hypothetical protein AI2912V1_1992 [Klebsiella pneumoniae]|nr:hypothetical protein AH0329V1_1412 [Klebsiella pneumoniae]CAF2774883.1 hypothetical protein AI2929V1_1412 [Klebsiella pneumoniae]CAF3278369.1 hypothetical protein AI3028V1_1411 [Klebsiella pneumoniae]CAF9402385.1 hypothetical protein AI2917V1_1412 [Klebsiella pneumoniae]CAF9402954.1 hypothetical protein AI2906V1_1412 [Klebsiella pneumoniae]